MMRILFLLLVVLWMGSPVSAKGKKAPKSQLKSFYYHVGGGMSISHQDEVDLRVKKDGQRLLTLRGDCFYERITFEVGEEVFLHCDSIIRATKLYQSKGFYESQFVLLDAPSTSFSASYTDYEESFSGSGQMPNEVWAGMRAVVDYLKGLRGDRQAFGHLTSDYSTSPRDIPDFTTTVWTDGIIEYIPDTVSFNELIHYLNGRYELKDDVSDWLVRYVSGNGLRCIEVVNNSERLLDVFVDKATLNVKQAGTDSLPGRWPQASQRLLTKGDLADIPTDSLELMLKEIDARYGGYFRENDVQAYFEAQPWYKRDTGYNSGLYNNHKLTDVERQNIELIGRYLEHRYAAERKAKQ